MMNPPHKTESSTSRQFNITGEQSGYVLLNSLAHGIEYKYAALDTLVGLWRQQTHFTPDLRLVINLCGHTHLHIGGRHFHLQAASGQAGLLLPMQESVVGEKIFYSGRQNEIVLFFNRAWLAEWCSRNPVLRQALLGSHLQPYYFPLTPAIRQQVAHLQQSHRMPEAWRRLYQEGQGITLLAEVLQWLFPSAGDADISHHPHDRRLAQLLDLLHDTGSGTLTLKELARACHSNPTTLQREFQAAYGQNIDQYRRAYRLSLARQALKSGCNSAEAARLAGYGNLQSFGRAFKKHFGHAPAESGDY